jgi:hypothetical protein
LLADPQRVIVEMHSDHDPAKHIIQTT